MEMLRKSIKAFKWSLQKGQIFPHF